MLMNGEKLDHKVCYSLSTFVSIIVVYLIRNNQPTNVNCCFLLRTLTSIACGGHPCVAMGRAFSIRV